MATKKYSNPSFSEIALDTEISLVMMSPPGDPEESPQDDKEKDKPMDSPFE